MNSQVEFNKYFRRYVIELQLVYATDQKGTG